MNSPPYVVSLLVTTEQEGAVRGYFQQRGWIYIKRGVRPADKDELDFFYKSLQHADTTQLEDSSETFQTLAPVPYSDHQPASAYGTFQNLLQSPVTMPHTNRMCQPWQGSNAEHPISLPVYQNMPVNFSLGSADGQSTNSVPGNESERNDLQNVTAGCGAQSPAQFETPVTSTSVQDTCVTSVPLNSMVSNISTSSPEDLSDGLSNPTIVLQGLPVGQSTSIQNNNEQTHIHSDLHSESICSRNDTVNNDKITGESKMEVSRDADLENTNNASENIENQNQSQGRTACEKTSSESNTQHVISDIQADNVPQEELGGESQRQECANKEGSLSQSAIDHTTILAAAVETIESIVSNTADERNEAAMNVVVSVLQNFMEISTSDLNLKQKLENLSEAGASSMNTSDPANNEENTREIKNSSQAGPNILPDKEIKDTNTKRNAIIKMRTRGRANMEKQKLKNIRKRTTSNGRKRKRKLKEFIKFQEDIDATQPLDDTDEDVTPITLDNSINDNSIEGDQANDFEAIDDNNDSCKQIKLEIEANDISDTEMYEVKDVRKRHNTRNGRKRSMREPQVIEKKSADRDTRTEKPIEHAAIWTREARYGINRNLRLHSFHRKCKTVPVDLDDSMFSEKENGYYCPDCNFIFPKRNKLLTHKKMKTGNRCVPDCIYCDAEENKNVFQCDKCPKVFESKELLERHVDTHNTNVFSCKICPVSFYTIPDLNFHLAQAHGEELKQTFLCDLCGSKFNEKKTLNAHRKYVHTDHRPEACPTCGRGFKTKSQLKNHLVTHKNMEDLHLSCEICGKMFARVATLKDHVRRHMKDFTFFCEICHKGFYKKFALEEHRRTHTGDKPYACKYCDFKCALSCNLAKHIRTHEKTKTVPLEYTPI